jgi:hypothetical protein
MGGKKISGVSPLEGLFIREHSIPTIKYREEAVKRVRSTCFRASKPLITDLLTLPVVIESKVLTTRAFLFCGRKVRPAGEAPWCGVSKRRAC